MEFLHFGKRHPTVIPLPEAASEETHTLYFAFLMVCHIVEVDVGDLRRFSLLTVAEAVEVDCLAAAREVEGATSDSLVSNRLGVLR